MNKPERISVRKAMRTDVTYIDGSKNVLDALRAMRDGEYPEAYEDDVERYYESLIR